MEDRNEKPQTTEELHENIEGKFAISQELKRL
jgi:hypothetical protein